MKAILGLVNGLVTTRNTRGGKSTAVVGRAKRGGLRWVRRVLMGSKGRWLAVGLALTLLHIDLAPAVASTELARSKGASVPSISLTERLSSLLLSVSSAVSQLQTRETPPLAPAPGLPPAWGASASVYGGVVNLGNGNLCLQVPLGTAGVGFTLVFNSQANPSQPSPIAPKWTHSWNVFVEVSSDNKRATVQEGDGSRWVYRDDDLDGVFVAPQGVFDRLVRGSDGRYMLVRKGSEERWVFAPSGALRRLERVEDKYGRAIVLSYDGNGRLQSVMDRYGRALGVEYQGARLWKVRDFAGREWTLMYENTGRLWKVLYPRVEDENEPPNMRVYEIAFGYNGRGNVISWTDRLGQVWRYGYTSATSDVLKWFRDAADNQWTAYYTLNPVQVEGGSASENGRTRWVDPTGVWVEYGFVSPVVARITQGGNATTERLTTRLWHNGQYQVIKRQDPAGLVWEWSYDAQGNLLWSKEPNRARTDYEYYAGTDRVWKITDALGYVWEYTYTSYGDVKSVKDPEGGVVQYVYDYELGEPAYGQVRRVIDALGRATEYAYYGADDTNLARWGQVKRVTVPGGYWREMDYGGAGWLVQRQVQTANGSEVTTYTYDAWGRLRGIDYPRSADVRMGWDGENRRVWVRDGVGERRYEYDAWGRVTKQRGCCGSADGIEVVAVSASYDEAGRKEFEREERADGSEVRTIRYTYDKLGRLETIGDYRGAVVYHYEAGTGRLQREDYPNGSYVAYTYYGSDNPSQVGFVWKVEHKRAANNSLLIGYKYTYDLLGRVVQSVEYPSGDKTEYAYTPAGRLESEVRAGQVWYRRYYKYNLDGSRHTVERDDMLNGEHVDVYAYDPVSGRLASVQDALTGEVNSFVWNPEGTLARWSGPVNNYDGSSIFYERFYEYSEFGFLTHHWRREGTGDIRLLEEFVYNGDNSLVHRINHWEGAEYRFVGCGSGCGAGSVRTVYRIYRRSTTDRNSDGEHQSSRWVSEEDYLYTPTSVWRSDPFPHSELRSPNSVWYHDVRPPEGEEHPLLLGGYLTDGLGLPVSEIPDIPSIRPWYPMPPYYHPIIPPLDLPSPYFPGNVIVIIPCIIKKATAVIHYGFTLEDVLPSEQIPRFPPTPPAYPSPPTSPKRPRPLQYIGGGWHGNWCGPGHPPDEYRPPNRGGGIRPGIEPIDALDSCCFNHDDCYETHNCGIPRIIFSIMCRLCDCALVRCAMSVDCNQSPFPDTCRRTQTRIGYLRALCFGL